MYVIGICDDEKGTCAELENMIYQYGEEKGVSLEVNVWFSGEELCRDLKKGWRPDILFLDIELISTDGVKIATYIREELELLDTMIVYISSKSSYAMRLFRTQPMDFLIKPLEETQVRDVLDLCICEYERKNKNFEVNTRTNYFKCPYKSIMYFYSQDKKINVVMKDKEIQFNGRLKMVEKRVPHNFIMIHQSSLINLDYVKECSLERVTLWDDTVLNVSQRYRKQVKEKIMRYKWSK